MSAYQNIYQGRTTKRAANNLMELGLIADQSKVSHDKAGQVSFLNPGALKGADLFKKDQFEWLEKVLLPALAQKGITSRDQVHDAIGSILQTVMHQTSLRRCMTSAIRSIKCEAQRWSR